MGNCVYSNKNYNIIKMNEKSFIVQNKEKEFSIGHTHVSNFHIGKVIIYCSINGEFPKSIKHLQKNKRVLESIVRVCSNKYKHKFEKMLLETKDKEDG